MYIIDKKTSEMISVQKFILIILVVFIHSFPNQFNPATKVFTLNQPEWLTFVETILSKIISHAAVPLFFLISSILLYKKEFTWKDNMKKKVRTILVPFIFWNTFWIIFYFIAQSIPVTAEYFSQPKNYIRDFGVMDYFDAYLGVFEREHPLLYPFWFLRDLFVMNIFAVVIKKLVDRFPLMTFAAIMVIWFWPGNDLLFVDVQVVFFILGYYLVKYNITMDMADRIKWRDILPIYIVLVLLYSQCIGEYTILLTSSVLLGIIIMIKISKVIVERERLKKVFINLSKYAFIIFAFHELNLVIFKKLLYKLLPQTTFFQIVQYFGLITFIIIFCIIFGYLMNRFLPKLYQIATGSRG